MKRDRRPLSNLRHDWLKRYKISLEEVGTSEEELLALERRGFVNWMRKEGWQRLNRHAASGYADELRRDFGQVRKLMQNYEVSYKELGIPRTMRERWEALLAQPT